MFAPTCDELGVSWFACKGYPSVSSLKDWLDLSDLACGGLQRWRFNYGPRWGGKLEAIENREGRAKRCVVLYFGDFDPDGWEIPRSAERNLAKLREVRWREGVEGNIAEDEDPEYFLEGERNSAYPIEFVRVALTSNQIRTYNPPPFEAKKTSARYKRYLEEHATDNAWELDALEPRVLRQLIRNKVSRYWNETIHQQNLELITERRDEMRAEMNVEGWERKA